MVNTEIPIKDSSIPFLLCDICRTNKGRSRKFKSIHALKWHNTHEHQNKVQFLLTVSNLTKITDCDLK